MSKSTEATEVTSCQVNNNKQQQKQGGHSAPSTNLNIAQMKKNSQLNNGGAASPMLMNAAPNAYECFSGSNQRNNKLIIDKQFSNQVGNLDITENDSHNGDQLNQNADTQYADNMFYFNNGIQGGGIFSQGGGTFKNGKSVISDGQEFKQAHSNMQVSSQSTTVAVGGSGSAGPLPMSNKSDASITQNASHSFVSGGVSNNQGQPQQIIGRGRGSGGISTNAKNTVQMAVNQAGSAEAKKKRKNSEKQKQRKASNNRRSDKEEDIKNINNQQKNTNGLVIPPIIDPNQGIGSSYQNGGGNLGSASGQQRSQSRGTISGGQQNNANQGYQKDQMNIHSNHQVLIQNFQQHHQQYYDPSQGSYNPFQNHASHQQDNQHFGMGLAAINGHFPFGNAGAGHFMGGGAGGVYAQAMQNKNGVNMNGVGNHYNIANAAFSNHTANILGGLGARTHTNGFSFHPATNNNAHKYSISLYGDEVKPKIAGKDIVQVLSSSNGFSGYQSDPYNSVMSGSLPASINHAVRLTKTKASQNRLQKDKEQLYDETIKMKMLNNQLKDDSVKLKTKIKILENELNRKEKTIEDLFSHNQMIQQSQLNNKGINFQVQSNMSNGQNLIPFTQTAQKYQQETFLVMSLKKQIRELKYEVVKRDEELEVLRKNIKNTRTIELEQEIQTFREECLRLRTILEELMKQGASHPIHQQAFQERINQLQADLQSKDALIQQLYERINFTQQQLENSNTYSPQVNLMQGVVTNGTTNTSSLAAVKSHESNQQLELSPSAAEFGNSNQTQENIVQQSNQQLQQNTFQSAARDKSGDKKNLPQSVQNSQQQYQNAHQQQAIIIKDGNKEVQKAKKNLREKEKEILKLKQEINQMRRESQEKLKNDCQQTSMPEQQVKTLKDRICNQKQEMKRKDEKLNETEQKIKKLEEQMKVQIDSQKVQEDQNKLLKSQLRAAKSQKQKILQQIGEQSNQSNSMKQGSTSATPQLDKKEEKNEIKDQSINENLVEKNLQMNQEKDKQINKDKKLDDASPTPEEQNSKKSTGNKKVLILDSQQQQKEGVVEKKKNLAQGEFQLMTLIGQREKLCRDDLTAMILAGEESLKMLIREPSDRLIDFIKAHLDNEDGLLSAIPRFEMPKTDFESQDKIADRTNEELMKWTDFEEFYNSLENFEYPHKDKLLDFIKYFFLDHIVNENLLMMNYQAFKEHLIVKRGQIGAGNLSAERTRNGSSLRSRRKSGESLGSFSESAENSMKRRLQLGIGADDERINEEERMLDIAEQCFMRIADLLHARRETVKQAFGRFAQPEPFKDGTVLELMTPRGFLVGVRELGFEDVSEMEAACLLKVLAKPELDGAVILNEFILIMENFGIPALSDEDEYENDYIPDSDSECKKETQDQQKQADGKVQDQNEKVSEQNNKDIQEDQQKEDQNNNDKNDEQNDQKQADASKSPQNLHPRLIKNQDATKIGKSKYPIIIDFEKLEEKSLKVLKKLARFLLERYMHPREFFGPTIKKEIIGQKKCKVEIIKLQDFYLRLKLASIRKKLKEKPNLNQFLAIDGDKFPGFVQVKRLIKTLEIIAEGEQEILLKEQEQKEKELKEKIQSEAKEREEKGLPPLTEDEMKNKNKTKTDPKGLKKGDKILDSTPKKTGLEEMMKLGGRGSPQNIRDREGHKLGSHLGLQGQLNTIEEDLHETQTSHYSQQLKDGDTSERGDISKHQLSTSNHLRNSNMLNELEDSSRRSNNGAIHNTGGPRNSLPNGLSVQSVDYSGGGSQASPIKGKLKHQDIQEQKYIENQVKIYQEEQDEQYQDDEDIDIDQDQDQKMKDELDAEVDKKYMKQLQSTRENKDIIKKNMKSNLDLNVEDIEEEYEDEKFYNRNKQNDEECDLKEDTIKTEKIEQIVDEDLKMIVDMNRENMNNEKCISTHTLNKNSKLQGIDENQEYQDYEDQEEMSIDELDVQAKLNDQTNTFQEKIDTVKNNDQCEQDSDIHEDYDYEF